jgi:hypothetical protein
LVIKQLTSAVTDSVTKDTMSVELIKLVAGMMRTVAQGFTAREMWLSPIAQISMNVSQQMINFLGVNIAIKMLFVPIQLVILHASVSRVMQTLLPGRDVLT